MWRFGQGALRAHLLQFSPLLFRGEILAVLSQLHQFTVYIFFLAIWSKSCG